MARVKIKIPRQVLKHLYWKEHQSPIKIAKLYSCTPVTVRTRMRELGIQKRTFSDARMQHRKFDFSGDKVEMAYLIGFRLGDLNVYRTSENSELIVARCNTTHIVQVELITKLFSQYGKVTISKGKISINIHCLLNKTFEFLLPKNTNIPFWIDDNINMSLAFIAGYTDAEGSFFLNQTRARFAISSYDYFILQWIAQWLQLKNIKVTLRCIAQKGTFRYDGRIFNKDLWRLNINEAFSLLQFIESIKPFIKHKIRFQDMLQCEQNIERRIINGSAKQYPSIKNP